MQIKLNNEKCSFWFLGNINLNYENPGPVDVDFDGLSLFDKKSIVASILTNKIKSDVVVTELQAKIAPAPKIVVMDESIKDNSPLPNEVDEERICAVLLKKNIGNLVKEIAQSNEVRKIRTMLKLEKEGKNRTKVLSVLESRFVFLQEQVSNKILNNKFPAKNVLSSKNDIYDDSVIETEEEEITIKYNE